VTEKREKDGGGRRKVLKGLEIVIWAGLLAFVAVRLWPQVAAVAGLGQPGAMAPELVVESLDGESIALEELRGSVVLVNFWATWCPPCRVEMPGFQSVYEDYRDQGFVILGLTTDVGSDRPVREFLAEKGIEYPNAMVGEREKRAFGGVPLLPTSILIDRNGAIRHRVEGFFAPPALRVAVRRLVNEEPVP
jgi:thiol-disulfide isomerase/thioredoxin